jgi:hypothetical protein
MKDKKAIREMHRFDKWMRTRVKTIHYADDKRMSEAYQKVYNNALP